MLRILLLSVLLTTSIKSRGQDTVEVTDNYTPGVTQKYHVLKGNPSVKEGLFQAFFKKKVVIASGFYSKGKRVGLWHFFNNNGQVVQHYSYNTSTPLFLTKTELLPEYMQYEFLPKPLATDSLTLPVKIGGFLFGYLPYLSKFKVKNDIDYTGDLHGVLQILVSPSGRLAECILLVKAKTWQGSGWVNNTVETYELNPELLDEYDKQFIPATVNHQNVSATIYIYCNITASGRLYVAQTLAE